jgi:uncharacterized membrane protein
MQRICRRSLRAARNLLLAALCGALSLAAAPAPERLAEVSVSGVRANDVLNLRSAPDARARIVGSLPANAQNIAVVGQSTAGVDWLMIDKGGVRGWVNARFLSYGERQQFRLPVRLSCAGTEPFWGIEVGYGRADAQLAYEDRGARIALGNAMPAAARPRIWLLPGTGARDRTSFLLVEARTCSDGMSDRSYPYTVAARVGDTLLSGCCR